MPDAAAGVRQGAPICRRSATPRPFSARGSVGVHGYLDCRAAGRWPGQCCGICRGLGSARSHNSDQLGSNNNMGRAKANAPPRSELARLAASRLSCSAWVCGQQVSGAAWTAHARPSPPQQHTGLRQLRNPHSCGPGRRQRASNQVRKQQEVPFRALSFTHISHACLLAGSTAPMMQLLLRHASHLAPPTSTQPPDLKVCS